MESPAYDIPDWIIPKEPWNYEPASTWMSWQNEGQNLKVDFPEKYGKDNYKGHFRLLKNSWGNLQNLAVEFEDGTLVWYFSLSLSKDFQSGPDFLLINGYLQYKYEHQANQSANRKASLKLELEEDQPTFSRFRYTLKIKDRKVIDTVFTTYKENYYIQNIIPTWLPTYSWKDEEGIHSYHPYISYALHIPFAWENLEPRVTTGFNTTAWFDNLYFIGQIQRSTSPYQGGMVQEGEIDEENKKVTYALRGGAPNDPVYVELHRVTDAYVNFRWMDSEKELVKEEMTWIPEDAR